MLAILLFFDLLFVCTETKGSSANLMKSEAKRKRTRKQIEEDKQEEVEKEAEAAANVEEILKLRAKVRKLELESK